MSSVVASGSLSLERFHLQAKTGARDALDVATARCMDTLSDCHAVALRNELRSLQSAENVRVALMVANGFGPRQRSVSPRSRNSPRSCSRRHRSRQRRAHNDFGLVARSQSEAERSPACTWAASQSSASSVAHARTIPIAKCGNAGSALVIPEPLSELQSSTSTMPPTSVLPTRRSVMPQTAPVMLPPAPPLHETAEQRPVSARRSCEVQGAGFATGRGASLPPTRRSTLALAAPAVPPLVLPAPEGSPQRFASPRRSGSVQGAGFADARAASSPPSRLSTTTLSPLAVPPHPLPQLHDTQQWLALSQRSCETQGAGVGLSGGGSQPPTYRSMASSTTTIASRPLGSEMAMQRPGPSRRNTEVHGAELTLAQPVTPTASLQGLLPPGPSRFSNRPLPTAPVGPSGLEIQEQVSIVQVQETSNGCATPAQCTDLLVPKEDETGFEEVKAAASAFESVNGYHSVEVYASTSVQSATQIGTVVENVQALQLPAPPSGAEPYSGERPICLESSSVVLDAEVITPVRNLPTRTLSATSGPKTAFQRGRTVAFSDVQEEARYEDDRSPAHYAGNSRGSYGPVGYSPCGTSEYWAPTRRATQCSFASHRLTTSSVPSSFFPKEHSIGELDNGLQLPCEQSRRASTMNSAFHMDAFGAHAAGTPGSQVPSVAARTNGSVSTSGFGSISE